MIHVIDDREVDNSRAVAVGNSEVFDRDDGVSVQGSLLDTSSSQRQSNRIQTLHLLFNYRKTDYDSTLYGVETAGVDVIVHLRPQSMILQVLLFWK